MKAKQLHKLIGTKYRAIGEQIVPDDAVMAGRDSQEIMCHIVAGQIALCAALTASVESLQKSELIPDAIATNALLHIRCVAEGIQAGLIASATGRRNEDDDTPEQNAPSTSAVN